MIYSAQPTSTITLRNISSPSVGGLSVLSESVVRSSFFDDPDANDDDNGSSIGAGTGAGSVVTIGGSSSRISNGDPVDEKSVQDLLLQRLAQLQRDIARVSDSMQQRTLQGEFEVERQHLIDHEIELRMHLNERTYWKHRHNELRLALERLHAEKAEAAARDEFHRAHELKVRVQFFESELQDAHAKFDQWSDASKMEL
jgi:hypothetical protein